MSETKFTPGPWLFSSYKSGNSVIVIDGKEFDVATVNYPNRDANAHLIAAAPELYEALSHLEPYLDAIICYASTIEEHPQNGYILETKAALAKARGEV